MESKTIVSYNISDVRNILNLLNGVVTQGIASSQAICEIVNILNSKPITNMQESE